MTTMLHHLACSCFSIFIISVVLVLLSLLFVVNQVEARTVKTRSFAPAMYRHNNNIDEFTTRLSYNTNNNHHHHDHDQPSSSSSTLDILFCSHNDKSLDDYEPIIRAESERLGHILQLSSVLDLIPASLLLQPMTMKNNNNNLLLPNSQRLFQVLPSVRERITSTTSKNKNENNNSEDDCLLIEVPLWESFACSAFIARVTELVTGSRTAAAELLVKELMILNNISSSSSSSISSSPASVSTIIDSLEEHQHHHVVLNDPSYTTSRAQARDAMVRSFHDRRDELDRAAALVYSALSKPKPKSSSHSTRKADFSFDLISNGKYSNYSLSLDFAAEKNSKNKNNNNDNNEEEIEIHTSIEQTSELTAIMTVDMARSGNNNRQQDDKKLSKCEILVRLPPHIAQLDYRYLVTSTTTTDTDNDDDDDRQPPILTFKHDDNSDDNNKVRIFPLSQHQQHQHQQDRDSYHRHHHQHHHVDRHWKSYWFVSSSSSSSSFTIPLRIPRLPVEAYPPDLNRLVTLPAVIGRCVKTTSRRSDANRPPTETSIEALGVLSRSSSSSSNNNNRLIRSINRVSLYQPGPDRAIPFVVLAFAMLVTSVLVIRTVSVVAVVSGGGTGDVVVEKKQ